MAALLIRHALLIGIPTDKFHLKSKLGLQYKL